MTYSTMDYVLPGIILPCLLAVMIFAVCICLSRYFTRKKQSLGIILSPILLCAILFYVALFRFHTGFNAPIVSLFQMGSPQYITVGKIDEIKSAPVPPLYYDEKTKSFDPAQRLTVNGNEYYVCSCDLQEQQWVEIIWATDQRIVYAWKSINPGEKVPGTYAAEAKTDSTENDSVHIGKQLLFISVAAFVLFTLLQYPIGHMVSKYLEKKDRLHDAAIVPNRFGLLYALMMFTPILGVLLGLYLQGFHGIAVIIVLAVIVVSRIVIQKQTTVIKYDGEMLSISECNTNRRFSAHDITSVSWCKSNFPFNRCLMVTFSNGYSIRMEQENFWGLENMYHKIVYNRTR